MAGSRVQEYLEKYSGEKIRFNPYAIKKLGLLQSQTLLKLEEFMLICAPYELSMQQVVLLVILSRGEIDFFQQFQNKLTSLNMSFQKPTNKSPINLFIRGTLTRMGPVKGRSNVSLFEVVYKSCPADLVEMIGDYLLTYEALKAQYENFKNRSVPMDDKTARTMRFNDYVESVLGGQKILTKLVSLAVNRIVLAVPARAPIPSEGQSFPSKLYFQTYQFLVNGTVLGVEQRDPEQKHVSLEVGFTPELVEIMDDYFFRMSFSKKE
jgi:hypothetical protein